MTTATLLRLGIPVRVDFQDPRDTVPNGELREASGQVAEALGIDYTDFFREVPENGNAQEASA